NGYDGPDRRIGPDLRLEPQFYAAALEITGSPGSGFENLEPADQSLVRDLADQPENDALRRRVLQLLSRDAEAEQPRLSEEIHNRVAPLLRDVEVPGKLRKPGPSLRYINHKADHQFLYDWIRDPQHFRPSTRMPKF